MNNDTKSGAASKCYVGGAFGGKRFDRQAKVGVGAHCMRLSMFSEIVD
jgi:hypothetical protein